jgi:UDP-glucose 4-epimerase
VRVLVLGAAGGVARLVGQQLVRKRHSVLGLDARPWAGPPVGFEVHQVDVRKRAAEEVFRRFRPEAIVHMATVTALTLRSGERERINLDGTQAVFDLARAHGVKQVLFVGRHTYYGAAADSPLYHNEDHPPRALGALPELADLVAADLYAATQLWRLPQLTTAVLRIVYTLGTPGSGTLASFLAGRRVPMVLGFDPLFHVMQETDVARAIALALEKQVRGIFNLAGPPPVPLSVIIRETGRTAVPVPAAVLRGMLGRFGFPRLSPGALDHLKFPIVVDAARFTEATGFKPDYDEVSLLQAFRDASPPRR